MEYIPSFLFVKDSYSLHENKPQDCTRLTQILLNFFGKKRQPQSFKSRLTRLTKKENLIKILKKEKVWIESFGENESESLDMKCKLCKVNVLNTNEFYDSCKKEGLKVDRVSGQVKISGSTYLSFGGAAYYKDYSKISQERDRLKKLHKEIGSRRAFKCKKCGKIYCLKCLAKKAPNNPSDGKTCPLCGRSVDLL